MQLETTHNSTSNDYHLDKEVRAKWATNRFMVDTQNSSNQETSQLGHAVSLLQSVLWSAGSELREDMQIKLSQDRPTFDKDWQWIGSYSMWRAATWAYLYPDNLLLPAHRRESKQTPGFRTLLNSLENDTPSDGFESSLSNYIGYFSDICNLVIQISATFYDPKSQGHDVLFFAKSHHTGKSLLVQAQVCRKHKY